MRHEISGGNVNFSKRAQEICGINFEMVAAERERLGSVSIWYRRFCSLLRFAGATKSPVFVKNPDSLFQKDDGTADLRFRRFSLVPRYADCLEPTIARGAGKCWDRISAACRLILCAATFAKCVVPRKVKRETRRTKGRRRSHAPSSLIFWPHGVLMQGDIHGSMKSDVSFELMCPPICLVWWYRKIKPHENSWYRKSLRRKRKAEHENAPAWRDCGAMKMGMRGNLPGTSFPHSDRRSACVAYDPRKSLIDLRSRRN
ncbi:MAG: hypothetical protein HQL44_09410 [Alphaproteobacteria bacterium]|nr:hypothetical protein [Alphaproteobacteria bacterium]